MSLNIPTIKCPLCGKEDKTTMVCGECWKKYDLINVLHALSAPEDRYQVKLKKLMEHVNNIAHKMKLEAL